ncbi:tyrosine-type recombinase/integrase [Fulvivirga sp.]|uniref:tyrosine-type recombinase/integrase n=1 Tax=Fulvivirga sp. TaxID=1931237 RepID=UPI0032EBCFFA
MFRRTCRTPDKKEFPNPRQISLSDLPHLMYTCLMEIAELINLRLCDIDSERKVIRVVSGKGNKSRSRIQYNQYP